MPSTLFVVTAADKWTLADGSARPTGYWAEELIAPHRVFKNAGWDIDFATPNAKAPVVDEYSLEVLSEGDRAEQENYLAEIGPDLEDPLNLADVKEADYDLVFYPGGHGPMEDLAYDQDSAKLLQERIESGRALSLVCHAPAALLALDNDNWPLKGYTMTGFTNAEEGEETIAAAKWVVETRLRELGADFKQTDPMQPYVEVDRNLYTGQNPASSEPLAQRILRDF